MSALEFEMVRLSEYAWAEIDCQHADLQTFHLAAQILKTFSEASQVAPCGL